MENTKARSVLVPKGAVSWLIAEARLRVRANSPLADFAGVPPAGSRDVLDRHGLRDPVWRSAFEILSAPDRRVRTMVVGPGRSLVSAYFGSRSSPNLVGWWTEGDSVRLLFPQPSSYIVEAAAEILQSAAESPNDAVAIELAPQGLLALAAIVDALRARLLASVLDREAPVDAPLLSVAEVERQFAAGVSGNDGRWIVTLWRLSVPALFSIEHESLQPGLAELLDRQLIRLDDRNMVQPALILYHLAHLWTVPQPAFATSVTDFDSAGDGVTDNLLAWRGGGLLWTLEADDIDGIACPGYVRSVTVPKYLSRLRDMVEPHRAELCVTCGATLRDGVRFCTHCGAAVAVPGVTA